MTSHHDIIARLERSPAAWVCIRREAADRIKADAARIKALEAKLDIAVSGLEYARDLTERWDIENCCIEALAKIKANSK